MRTGFLAGNDPWGAVLRGGGLQNGEGWGVEVNDLRAGSVAENDLLDLAKSGGLAKWRANDGVVSTVSAKPLST